MLEPFRTVDLLFVEEATDEEEELVLPGRTFIQNVGRCLTTTSYARTTAAHTLRIPCAETGTTCDTASAILHA
jgi:hypothetical protein